MLRQLAYQSRKMSVTSISTNNAPSAIGPYSQAVRANGFIFISGCLPMDPKSMTIVNGGITEQTTQALKNLGQVIEASGSAVNKVAKTTVFLKNMDNFADMNVVYSNFFKDHKPARSAVEVARLPKDVLVEVEAIVVE